MEIMLIVEELGYLALAVTLAGSYVAATPRLRSDIRSYLPEYRERRKQLPGMKARRKRVILPGADLIGNAHMAATSSSSSYLAILRYIRRSRDSTVPMDSSTGI